MADRDEIAPLICGVCETDASTRAEAAAKIFARGCEMARAATQEWLAHAPLANLLVRDRFGSLEMTVGIAVEPDNFDRVRSANGSPRLAEVPPEQDAKEFELEFAEGVRIDVLTTREPGGAGAIARYLQKLGEGIQQVEIVVTDVDRATEFLRTRFAVEAIYPATRAGADGTRINFFLAPTAHGRKVLIELVETKPKS
jgi:hypothetical protein